MRGTLESTSATSGDKVSPAEGLDAGYGQDLGVGGSCIMLGEGKGKEREERKWRKELARQRVQN